MISSQRLRPLDHEAGLKQVSSVSYKTVKMSVVHYVIGHVFMLLRYIIRFQYLC